MNTYLCTGMQHSWTVSLWYWLQSSWLFTTWRRRQLP